MPETLRVFSINTDIYFLYTHKSIHHHSIHKSIHWQDIMSGQHRFMIKLNVVFLCLEYVFRYPKLNFKTDNTKESHKK